MLFTFLLLFLFLQEIFFSFFFQDFVKIEKTKIKNLFIIRLSFTAVYRFCSVIIPTFLYVFKYFVFFPYEFTIVVIMFWVSLMCFNRLLKNDLDVLII